MILIHPPFIFMTFLILFDKYPFFFDKSKLSSNQYLSEKVFSKLRILSKETFGKLRKGKIENQEVN